MLHCDLDKKVISLLYYKKSKPKDLMNIISNQTTSRPSSPRCVVDYYQRALLYSHANKKKAVVSFSLVTVIQILPDEEDAEKVEEGEIATQGYANYKDNFVICI